MRLGGKLKKQNGPVKSSQNQVSVEEQTEFISLQEAANYCKIYSQEYLSLRARQGKLQAIKMGRNWVTTKQWVDEYLAQVNDYNNNRTNGNGHGNGHSNDSTAQKNESEKANLEDEKSAGVGIHSSEDLKTKWQPN